MFVLTQLVCLPMTAEKNEVCCGGSRMSGARLSSGAQLRYMLQWFEEWSELQRQDFLPLLADKLSGPVPYLNGVVGSMAAVNCHSKPMNLFQCRIKLFNEWYPTWTEEERGRLVRGVSDVDPHFGAKLQEELASEREPSPARDGAYPPVANGDGGEGPHDGSEATEDAAPEPAERHDTDDEVAPDSLPENALPLEIAATS